MRIQQTCNSRQTQTMGSKCMRRICRENLVRVRREAMRRVCREGHAASLPPGMHCGRLCFSSWRARTVPIMGNKFEVVTHVRVQRRAWNVPARGDELEDATRPCAVARQSPPERPSDPMRGAPGSIDSDRPCKACEPAEGLGCRRAVRCPHALRALPASPAPQPRPATRPLGRLAR